MSFIKAMLVASLLFFYSSYCFALQGEPSDKHTINSLLNSFLANELSDDLANHDKFWADDLVYTSSSGTRFDKAFIIEGIKADLAKKNTTKNNAANSDDSTTPSYWAEETDIRLYGTTAIVAFKLMATWQENSVKQQQSYYNTGTLLKRDGQWQVVAWQATKIPVK